MKNIVGLSIVLILAGIVGCTNHQERKKLPGRIYELGWLLGRWEDNSEEGLLSETWTRKNDSVYIAETYFEVKGDTVFSEKIRLEEHMDGVYYIPTVSNQNNGKPMQFKMTTFGKRSVVFENPKHDFPQKIVYTTAGDSIIAEISGMKDGTMKKELFAMGRSD